jgi:hypothetical protein
MHYAMDADLFLRMASRHTLQHIDLDIAYSVYHEDCKTRSARAESIVELARVQAMHGGHAQSAATLELLVDLYKASQARVAELESAPAAGDSMRERALLTRVSELERRLALLAETYVQIDALESA